MFRKVSGNLFFVKTAIRSKRLSTMFRCSTFLGGAYQSKKRFDIIFKIWKFVISVNLWIATAYNVCTYCIKHWKINWPYAIVSAHQCCMPFSRSMLSFCNLVSLNRLSTQRYVTYCREEWCCNCGMQKTSFLLVTKPGIRPIRDGRHMAWLI